jgi:hypothetical protein
MRRRYGAELHRSPECADTRAPCQRPIPADRKSTQRILDRDNPGRRPLRGRGSPNIHGGVAQGSEDVYDRFSMISPVASSSGTMAIIRLFALAAPRAR